MCLSLCLSAYLPLCLPACLPVGLPVCLSACLPVCLSVYLSTCLSTYLSNYRSVCLPIYLSVYLSNYRCVCLSAYLSVCLSIYLSIHPYIYLSLPLSTHLSIYLSSIYLSVYLKGCVQSWRPRTNAFCDLAAPSTSPATNSEVRSYEIPHLSHRIILADLKIWCSKSQPLSGNNRLDLLTCLMEICLVLRVPRDMYQILFTRPTPAIVIETATKPHKFGSLLARRRSHCTWWFNVQKVVRTWCVFQNFGFKMCFAPDNRLFLPFASRHNSVHFFDISTFHKCSENGTLNMLTSKCASRHKGVYFFNISTSKVLRTWCVLYILTRALKLSKLSSFLKAEGNSLAGFARLHCQPKQSRRCMKMSQSHCLSSSLETKAHPPRQQNTALYQQESEQGRPRYFPSSVCDSWGGGHPTTKQ